MKTKDWIVAGIAAAVGVVFAVLGLPLVAMAFLVVEVGIIAYRLGRETTKEAQRLQK